MRGIQCFNALVYLSRLFWRPAEPARGAEASLCLSAGSGSAGLSSVTLWNCLITPIMIIEAVVIILARCHWMALETRGVPRCFIQGPTASFPLMLHCRIKTNLISHSTDYLFSSTFPSSPCPPPQPLIPCTLFMYQSCLTLDQRVQNESDRRGPQDNLTQDPCWGLSCIVLSSYQHPCPPHARPPSLKAQHTGPHPPSPPQSPQTLQSQKLLFNRPQQRGARPRQVRRMTGNHDDQETNLRKVLLYQLPDLIT